MLKIFDVYFISEKCVGKFSLVIITGRIFDLLYIHHTTDYMHFTYSVDNTYC